MSEGDPAASWFVAMQLMRLIGVVHVVVGAMAIAGTIGLPAVMGASLLVTGLAVFFLAPWAMAKAWKNRDK